MLELKNIGLTYFSENGETKAIKDISFNVKEGEFIAILGPSGCGKTTILSLISGLLTPTSGEIKLFGKPIVAHQNHSGYMFQKDHLFEWRSVLKNIYLGLEIQKKKTIKTIKQQYEQNNKNKKNNKKLKQIIKQKLKQQKEYADKLLKKYGLWEFKSKYPNQLSGGMRQRVALIRTLALNPQILLLDEPFSALDYQTRLNLCDDVSNIIKSEKKTAILVTHDITEALSMANKIIVLSKRPAQIINVHSLEIDPSFTPLKRRESGVFLTCFDKIWKELQQNNEK